MRRLAASEPGPWSRSLPLHFTASALVVQPDSGRVLLRWHQRQRMWLQAGGHGDPGETDPLAIALREAREETGLPDLVPWPDGALRHAVVCRVAPGKGEPAHEHADLRFIVATSAPDAARPETRTLRFAGSPSPRPVNSSAPTTSGTPWTVRRRCSRYRVSSDTPVEVRRRSKSTDPTGATLPEPTRAPA